jgi:hypothetical protein
MWEANRFPVISRLANLFLGSSEPGIWPQATEKEGRLPSLAASRDFTVFPENPGFKAS